MIATLESPPINTLGDLLNRLGGIPADRVRFRPMPGEASEQDCFDAKQKLGVLCELIDGTLVEKSMGLFESVIAGILIGWLRAFVSPRRLGIVGSPDGMFRVGENKIRMPDVSFTSWNRIPADYSSHAAVDVAPDLAIEILSPSNTAAEMKRKRSDLFAAGTRLMWIVDPAARTIAVCIDADSTPTLFGENQSIDGGAVLPGFSFSIGQLFAEAQRPV
jgi:Uma2 family endonuclease